MSFASILSGPADETPVRKPSPPVHKARAPEPPAIAPAPRPARLEPEPEKRRQPSSRYDPAYSDIAPRPVSNGNAVIKPSPQLLPLKPRKPERSNSEKLADAMARIEQIDKSDVEAPGFEDEWQRYKAKSRKRARESEATEAQKRKVSNSSVSVALLCET